jgi:hypothetical protein
MKSDPMATTQMEEKRRRVKNWNKSGTRGVKIKRSKM